MIAYHFLRSDMTARFGGEPACCPCWEEGDMDDRILYSQTDPAVCAHCGNDATGRSLILMWFRFEPPDPDEPRFTLPFCGDQACNAPIMARLTVQRREWELRIAEMALARARAAVPKGG